MQHYGLYRTLKEKETPGPLRRFPAFPLELGQDHPSRIIGGFGGTLNLVLSLLFVILILALQALPSLSFAGVSIGVLSFRVLTLSFLSVLALLSLVACLLPMKLGLRSLARLET